MAFDLKIIPGGSFGQVAAGDKQAFAGAGIPPQNVDGCFLTSQTARLFFVSTTEFDIAGERAYIDEAKIRLFSPAAGGKKQVEEEGEENETQ